MEPHANVVGIITYIMPRADQLSATDLVDLFDQGMWYLSTTTQKAAADHMTRAARPGGG